MFVCVCLYLLVLLILDWLPYRCPGTGAGTIYSDILGLIVFHVQRHINLI